MRKTARFATVIALSFALVSPAFAWPSGWGGRDDPGRDPPGSRGDVTFGDAPDGETFGRPGDGSWSDRGFGGGDAIDSQ